MSIVRRVLPAAAALFVALAAGKAQAIPILQLYIEGATYNTTTESWEYTALSSGDPFRIWTIGNISGQGGKGPISDVKLAAVYDLSVGDVTITLTPTLMGGDLIGAFGGFTDADTPDAPALLQGPAGTEGETPLLGDGTPLAPHGEYGAGRVWQEFLLGDFDEEDSQLGDFITNFPTAGTGLKAQINVYQVSVSGDFDNPFAIHFDLYNHVGAENHVKYKFAPFSHDADGTPDDGPDINEMPEPASATLLGMACLSLFGGCCLRRRQKSSAN